MSCNHKNRVVVASGTWKRPWKSFVKSDTVRVSECRTCGAIKLDWYNEFCFQGGKWSSRKT